MALHVRAARASDHALFARLFPELGTDDPLLDEETFVREAVPTTLIADEETPDAGPVRSVGYAYFQVMKDMAYVRHIVTAPDARRGGVGRALMLGILARARQAGCSTWCLNVKPGNTAAIALYESHGMKRTYGSRVVTVAWAVVDALAGATDTAHVVAKAIAPEDDARVESATHLVEGQLAANRALGDRVLVMLEEEGSVVGATSFAPNFPGAYPFRVARPELALVLLRAIRPYARPLDTQLGVVTEDQPEVADALVSRGATVKFDIVHMSGALPPA